MEVVSKHNTMNGCWVIFNGEVIIKCCNPGGSQILILGNNNYRSRHKNETIFNDILFIFFLWSRKVFWKLNP